ncbi:Uncharacterised protein [Moraxella cuniculi]|uniref:Uncharacterized protein n=2 Tax=Moraxella cuniculi TaxID=34061 RepID=A0A3S4SXY4_9GAMM|nr:Uncharacterised protein [Moraxella cuniculi]
MPNNRHYADKITQKSLAKEQNTIIDRSKVDVQSDVDAIRNGKAVFINNQYHINGRIYGHHDGVLYPISGNGFYTLSRIEFKTFGVFSQFGNT